MPNIKPISYLRNTKEVLKLCDKSSEAIYLTKNGYKAITVVNSEKYDRDMLLLDFYKKMFEASQDKLEGKVFTAEEVFKEIEKKYGLQD